MLNDEQKKGASRFFVHHSAFIIHRFF